MSAVPAVPSFAVEGYAATKKCIRCEDVKSLAEFPTDRSRKDGKKNICRDCGNARTKELRLENPERFRSYKREWLKKNPEKQKKTWMLRYARHKDRLREVAKKWRQDNRERARATQRKSAFIRMLDPVKRGRRQAEARLYYLNNRHKYQERRERYRAEGRHHASAPVELNAGFNNSNAGERGDTIADVSAVNPESSLLFSELMEWVETRISESQRQFLDTYMDSGFDLAAAAAECGLSVSDAGEMLSEIQTLAAQEFGNE